MKKNLPCDYKRRIIESKLYSWSVNIELQRNAPFHRNMKKRKGGWNEWQENQA